MSIEEYGEYFSSALSESSIAVLPETALHAVAADIMGMAEAYCSDGHEFFLQFDRVNAHAAFTYNSKLHPLDPAILEIRETGNTRKWLRRSKDANQNESHAKRAGYGDFWFRLI